jgi:hypothetical protein
MDINSGDFVTCHKCWCFLARSLDALVSYIDIKLMMDILYYSIVGLRRLSMMWYTGMISTSFLEFRLMLNT